MGKWSALMATGSLATRSVCGDLKIDIQIKTFLRSIQMFAVKSQPMEAHFVHLTQR